MVMEETRKGYIAGSYVLRISDDAGGFREYRIKYHNDKYQVLGWSKGEPHSEVLVECGTGDEAWEFLKLIGVNDGY